MSFFDHYSDEIYVDSINLHPPHDIPLHTLPFYHQGTIVGESGFSNDTMEHNMHDDPLLLKA